jgi:hypothetical protein
VSGRRVTDGNISQASGKADGTGVLKDSSPALPAADRVASGRYRPEAPTDPYVLAFEHTVPQGTARIVIDRVARRREKPAGTSIDTWGKGGKRTCKAGEGPLFAVTPGSALHLLFRAKPDEL